MNYSVLKGTGVALVTPFDRNLNIDFEALARVLDHIISGGADFIVVLGTTGETALLTHKEKLQIIEFVKQKTKGEIPLVLGYGGISTAHMIEEFSEFDFDGITALLTVTPYYVKPSQQGLYQHYKAIADVAPLPIILYNVPGRTGINMEQDTTLALSGHPNIIGIKEASGKLFQIEDILNRKDPEFLLFSGEDALTFHFMNAGAEGVISVMGNAFPSEIKTIVNSPNNLEAAKTLHLRLKLLTKMVFADGNPCGIKYVLSRRGLCKNILRLPLVPVSESTAEAIDKELIGLI